MSASRVSLKVVADKLLRDPLFNNIGFETIIDYCIEFLQIVSVPDMFADSYVNLEAEEYRCKLPDDFIYLNQLLLNGAPAREATDTFHNFYSQVKTSGNFAMPQRDSMQRSADPSFKIQGGYIYLSEENGQVQLSYKSIPLDENGVPTIPDNEVFMRALRLYIEQAWIIILWRQGKVSDKVYQDVQQRYAWAVGQCETDMRKLDMSRAETLLNTTNTLIPRTQEFASRFRNMGSREFIRRH